MESRTIKKNATIARNNAVLCMSYAKQWKTKKKTGEGNKGTNCLIVPINRWKTPNTWQWAHYKGVVAMDKGAQGPIQNGLFSGWMIWVQTLPSNLFAGRNKCILTSNAVVQDASTTATSNKQQATKLASKLINDHFMNGQLQRLLLPRDTICSNSELMWLKLVTDKPSLQICWTSNVCKCDLWKWEAWAKVIPLTRTLSFRLLW